MTIRLTLVCQGATAAISRVSFAHDEPLTDRSARAIGGAPGERPTAAWCSPAVAAWQTAAGLGLDPLIEPALRDCDYGLWRGRTLADVQAAEPEAFQEWFTDPAARPHGGESITDLVTRVGDWLSNLNGSAHGRSFAVTHAAVIRALLVNVLAAPPASFWRIDVPPLSRIRLTAHRGRWQFRTAVTD
ncbi:histidine phosphatase family protein [Microtetraspora malaysiensis]|uniref:histidine phosphatase family protein n=1 Tax=Microtetraspora malaysiensis TaxID=161358 RepID=UPI003D94DF8A